MTQIILLLYAIRTVRNILYHLFWWDMKEWRFDRMKVHLTETYQGKRWMFGPLSLIKWVVLFLYIFPVSFILNSVVYLIYVFEAGKILATYSYDKRPKSIRPKIAVIGIGTIIAIAGIVLIVSFDYPLGFALLVGDKLLGFIIFFEVMIVGFFYWFYKNAKIQMAREKISSFPHLKVIGVTGSYGKTSVKEILYKILSKKYRVCKTDKSQNSDIGIAEKILRTDFSRYDYFICEMAAYHPGEIASSTSMMLDKIIGAVITGINQQHQSLFKSIKTTMKSKYELIQSVRNDGVVVVNAENTLSKKMGNWAEKEGKRVVYVRKISNLTLPKNIPDYFSINIALAVKLAQHLGMKKKDILSQVKKITLPDKTMNIRKYKSLIIIDDTFNANPDAVYKALSYMKKKKGKKVLVLQPLIELGAYAESVHKKIGRMAAQVCDIIVLTNKNWYKPFIEGVGKKEANIKVLVGENPLTRIKKGIVLFEGKEAEKYLPFI